MNALLIDLEAERGLIACMLENACPRDFDPMVITSDYIGVLFLATKTLMDHRLLYFPSDYGNAGECIRVARANAELVCHKIDVTGVWPAGSESSRWVVRQCLEHQSLPWLIDYYVDRIETAERRRWLVERAEELKRQAFAPGPLASKGTP